MPDLISDGGEFSCNFCTSKLKLTVTSSSTKGDSKKLANQGNCFFPPPGGNCTFPPGVPPTPCPGVPPGCVVSTGQQTVKIDQQTALGDGCKFMCPKGQMVSLSSAGQSKAKHDEAAGGIGTKVLIGGLIVAGVVLAIVLLPEEAVAGVAIVAARVLGAAAKVAKNAVKALKKTKPKAPKASGGSPKSPMRNKKGSVNKSLPKDPSKDPRYEDVSHPKAAERGHYQYKNKESGEVVNFDKGKPGAPGHKGADHYHRPNPNSTSKLDRYLDGEGNPVPDGSDASHIYPD